MKGFLQKPASIVLGVLSVFGFIGAYFYPDITAVVVSIIKVSDLVVWATLFSLGAICAAFFFSSAWGYWRQLMLGHLGVSRRGLLGTISSPKIIERAVDEEELVWHLTNYFNEVPDGLGLFIDSCIKYPLQNTVEHDAGIYLAKEQENLLAEKIKVTKGHTLSEIEYGPSDATKFSIKLGNDIVEFANEDSTMGLLKGALLRKALDELRVKNPDMTLYGALNGLVSDPRKHVLYFLTPLFFKVPELAFFRNKSRILTAFVKLCIAGEKYILEEKARGVSEEELISRLKYAMQENLKKIILKALTESSSIDNIKEILYITRDYIFDSLVSSAASSKNSDALLHIKDEVIAQEAAAMAKLRQQK